MSKESLRKFLPTATGYVDMGLLYELIKEIPIVITPEYAKWLESNEDPNIILGDTTAPGKHFVQEAIFNNWAIVRMLIEKGVPEEVALGLLPHELYEILKKEDATL